MPSRRCLKAAEAIREVVSMAILADLKDPRVENVTVTFVEVSGDMRQAKVHVSIMGDETKQRLGLRGLQSAAGYLQRKVGNRIETRYTPRIEFELDQGVKRSIEVARILNEVLPGGPAEDEANRYADEEDGELDADEADTDAVEEDELEGEYGSADRQHEVANDEKGADDDHHDEPEAG